MSGRARLAPFVVLLGLSFGAARAAATGPAPVVSWTADEGTTIALAEDHRVPLVTLVLEFPVGTWSPWARRAHAREAWEIQMHDAAGRLRERAAILAADIELSMGDRSCALRASFLEDDLSDVLRLVRDVLTNRAFDRRELRARRRAQRFLWEANETQPRFRVMQEAARALFGPDDPRRRAWERPEPMETDPRFLAEARDAIVRLPGRIVGFAGDLTREEAERAARGLLPEAGRAPEDLSREPGAIARGDDRTVPMRKLTQTYFAYLRDSLPWDDPDAPALVIADHVLGGHFHSRLTTALRHETGETYGASTTTTGDVEPGIYALTTFTRADNADAVDRRLRELLADFRTSGITEDERQAAAGFLLGRRAYFRQSPEQILDRWMLERRLGLPAGFLDARAERAAALSLDEVNAVVRRWFDPDRFVMVRVEPSP